MKLVFGILLILWASKMSMGMSLLNHQNHFQGNFEYVAESRVGSMDLISDTLISFEHNKLKAQYTTFSGDMPAFDVVLDFSEGLTYQYFNLTGKCQVSKAPKMNLAEYYETLFSNFTEFAGFRGEHLEVYEIKHPEEEGSRTWLYGMTVGGTHGGKVFMPTRFQTHYPAEDNDGTHDFTGEFLDTVNTPSVSPDAFDYPACKEANVIESDTSVTFGVLGANYGFLLQTFKK